LTVDTEKRGNTQIMQANIRQDIAMAFGIIATATLLPVIQNIPCEALPVSDESGVLQQRGYPTPFPRADFWPCASVAGMRAMRLQKACAVFPATPCPGRYRCKILL
jgi:hypothetical protein